MLERVYLEVTCAIREAMEGDIARYVLISQLEADLSVIQPTKDEFTPLKQSDSPAFRELYPMLNDLLQRSPVEEWYSGSYSCFHLVIRVQSAHKFSS